MRIESLGASYLALPDGPAPYPGVVVIHEASGLNDNIRGICRRFAAEGYAALGVDLFEGRNRAACMARMFIGGMAGNLNYYGVPALKAALGRLEGHPEVDADRIGAIGFCLGGSIILTWACTDGRLGAIAPFYGAAPKPREAVGGQAQRAGPFFSSWCFNSVQILRSIRLPRGRTSGLSIRIQPFGCTCQSQPITVPSPSAAKVSAPEVSIIELVVREPSRCGRSNAVNSTSISVPALPMRVRNRVPNPIGSGVSNSTPAMAGLNDGSLRESATVSNTCSTGAVMRT